MPVSVNVFLRETMMSVILEKFFFFLPKKILKVTDIYNKRNAWVIFCNFECYIQSWHYIDIHNTGKPFGCFSLRAKCYNIIALM